ncbi:MAG TPA: hypothetical protein VNW97_04775 [Candidatus Saccharimonadales bacterium]|jgi:hypothetical protein|nr:hypothetical protein [Candidatus Saccharimonadales bacterium]
MSTTTTFTVFNNLPAETQDHVLVFLKPLRASPNFQYYAWQDLNPSQNSSQSFPYLIDLSVQVFDPTVYAGKQGAIAAPVSINPGQLFPAVNPNGQSPFIDPSSNLNTGQITPSQAAVINQCNSGSYSCIGLNWFNTGNLVVTAGQGTSHLNYGKTITLEFEPTLYFMAAEPTLIGPNFTLQDYSLMVPYTFKAGTTDVTVNWTRTEICGEDIFTFTPPSAVIGL